MTPLDSAEMVDRVFGGRYRIVGLIGEGSVSQVYVADDTETATRVAIKVFDQSIGENPDHADRVVAAVGAAACVEHPNIVPVLDWGLDGVRLWVVSELCAGGSLRTMSDFGSTLTPSQALVVSLELARALAHAHAHGVVHLGIKPENVLFSSDQRVRIADFGLRPVLADAPLREPSAAVEQVRYTSPEQSGGRAIEDTTDLYSLALVINESVTAIQPGLADTVVASKIARAESPASLGELGALRGPLERCGRLDPTERPDAEELSIALLAAAESMSRPGPLPLAGIPGFVDVEVSTVVAPPDSDAEIDVEVPSVEIPAIDPDQGDRSLTIVPALPDRVALEDLDTAEPIFAEAEVAEAVLDIPAAAATTGTGVFRPDDEDLDDQLPLWPLAVLIALVAAAAVVGFVFGRGVGMGAEAVPNLVGLDESEIAVALGEADWQIERLEDRVDGTVAGAVVAQDPEAGTELDGGETLTVTVSLGPPMVELPGDLGGLTLEQAQTRLAGANLLVGTVTEEPSETVDRGLVIGLDEPTRQKPQGEAVALRLSLGAPDRVVPESIIGVSIADATETLTGLRLQAVEEQVYDPVAEPGTVLGAVPGAGQTVPADSLVTLLVSAGPEPIEMPDLAELSLAEARDVIDELGLIFIDTEGTPGEPVIATIPAAGEIVDIGAEIIVVLGEPEDPDAEDPDAADPADDEG